MPAGRSRSVDRGFVAALAIALVWGAAFATLAIRKHQSFHSNAYDLGLQHHVVWNTAQGRWFEYTYMVAFPPGLENHLGDHVNLVLLPIAALYRLHDGPETLLVVQAAVVASGFLPLFLVARRSLGAIAGADALALALAALLLLHPALQAAMLFDFHPIVLAAPLFLWAYWLAQAGRAGWLALVAVLLLATQENAALVVALLGALLLLEGRRRAGAALLVAGAAWFAICFFVVLPAFNPGVGSNAFSRYRHLGESWWAVALRLASDPIAVAGHALDASGRGYLWSLAAPFGFLGLLAPEVLLCAASELALNLLSDFPLQRTIDYQYASVPVAVGALAAVVGAGRLVRLASARLGVRPGVAGAAVVASALIASLGSQWHTYGGLRAVGSEYAGIYTVGEHARAGHQVLARIPPDAPVSAQGPIAPHVSRRRRVYVFPTVADAEWVVLDERAGIFPVHLLPIPGMTPEASYREYVRRLVAGGEFATALEVDGWRLLRRVVPAREASLGDGSSGRP